MLLSRCFACLVLGVVFSFPSSSQAAVIVISNTTDQTISFELSHPKGEVRKEELLGKECRIMEVGARNQGPELDARGRCRDRPHQGPGLPRAARFSIRPAIEQVFADPERVEPGVLDRSNHVEDLGPADVTLDLRELNANPQWAVGFRTGAHPGSVRAAAFR